MGRFPDPPLIDAPRPVRRLRGVPKSGSTAMPLAALARQQVLEVRVEAPHAAGQHECDGEVELGRRRQVGLEQRQQRIVA